MTINDVMQMFSLVDSNKQCIGNNDQKFERVADVHNGVFKDMAGNPSWVCLCVSVLVYGCDMHSLHVSFLLL